MKTVKSTCNSRFYGNNGGEHPELEAADRQIHSDDPDYTIQAPGEDGFTPLGADTDEGGSGQDFEIRFEYDEFSTVKPRDEDQVRDHTPASIYI